MNAFPEEVENPNTSCTEHLQEPSRASNLDFSGRGSDESNEDVYESCSFAQDIMCYDSKDLVPSGARKDFKGRVRSLTECTSYKLALAMVIISNMVIGVVETDLRAAGKDAPLWATACSFAMLTTYVIDIVLRVIALGKPFFYDIPNLFDLFIVALDALVTVLFSSTFSLFGSGNNPKTSLVLACLRGLRMLRTFRVLRNFFVFRELYVMLQGFTSAIRTLLFGLCLVLVVLTSWSILAVEVLNPLNKELAENGHYIYCDRCRRAFDSVMASNLTFLKGILAGDSWGEVSVPLMESSPLATIILVCVFVTLQWGLMNIITAVIVDAQTAARARDDKLTAVLKKEELQGSYDKLMHLFKKIDNDGSGFLTLPELLESFKTMPEFRELLSLMDISGEHLPILFEILDQDKSGGVDYKEFMRQLHVIKTFDSHTLLVFIKHLVTKNQDQMNKYFKKIENMMTAIAHDLRDHFQTLQCPENCETTALDHSVSQNAKSSQTSVGYHQRQPCVDEHMRLLGSVRDQNTDVNTSWSHSPLPSASETQALIATWDKRLQEDLAEITACASKRVAASREWLQRSWPVPPKVFEVCYYHQTAVESLRQRSGSFDGKMTSAPLSGESMKSGIFRNGVGVDILGRDWQHGRELDQYQVAPERHFRPHSRRTDAVSGHH